jgi:2-C-methyl-D-erythritol 4-phosphate cytidylyltransferase
MSKKIAIIFAGGVGKRMNDTQVPKQFIVVDEKPIIIHTLNYFENHAEIDDIVIACVGGWIPYLTKLLEDFEITKVSAVIEGGATAQDSIYAALKEAQAKHSGDATVLIHDGVRPFITSRLITDLIASVESFGTGVTCTPCFETIIISKDDGGLVGEVPFRKDIYAAQAPQAFRLDDIVAVHDTIRKSNPRYENMVDACTMYRQLGMDVRMVKGNIGNIKITKPEDVFILEGLIAYRKNEEIMGLSLLDLK